MGIKLLWVIFIEQLQFSDWNIIVTSELRPTYEKTLRQHFENLEKAVARLYFHGAKLSVSKSRRFLLYTEYF